uniref:Choline transporter-like protein n=1 Tax=Sphaeramia orbicularis TaxID=375764 RepID=A0A672YBI3_9TELE
CMCCSSTCSICGFAIATGAASRLISGYDSYGNTCGSELCTYDITPTRYASHPDLHKGICQFVSDNSVLHWVTAGVMASKEIIMGLCVLALGIICLFYIWPTVLLVWILTILVIVCSIGGTGVLWWLYCGPRNALNNNTPSIFGKEVDEDNVKALLVYAIGATVFTVCLCSGFPRACCSHIALFHVAGKVFIHIPLLVLQPFWTFLCLMLFWVYWIAVLLFLGTAGTPIKNNATDLVEYKLQGPLQYMVEFILAFQQMTIAGAVVTTISQATPILSAYGTYLRYHLGTLIPRLILTYIHSQLKGKVRNACARCMLKACVCCLWCLEKCLAYLNQNAYTATAINSTSFCTSARDAFLILVENALRVVLIVSCTAFAGVLALNYQREYTRVGLTSPHSLSVAYLVAHCFLSVFENVVDVLFPLLAVDTKSNDGSPGREYYMDKKWDCTSQVDGDGREMKPMVSYYISLVPPVLNGFTLVT